MHLASTNLSDHEGCVPYLSNAVLGLQRRKINRKARELSVGRSPVRRPFFPSRWFLLRHYYFGYLAVARVPLG